MKLTLCHDTQNDIYYVTGESKKQVENSPFLEKLKKKGVEVNFVFSPPVVLNIYCTTPGSHLKPLTWEYHPLLSSTAQPLALPLCMFPIILILYM